MSIDKIKESAAESAKKIYKVADIARTTSAKQKFKVKGSYNNYVR